MVLCIGECCEDSKIKAARNSNAKLASREEMAGKGVGKDGGVDGSSKAALGSANANRTLFATATIRILAQSNKADGGK